LLQRNR